MVAVADVGVQHRHRRRALPGHLQVALVGDQQRAALPAPRDHLAEVVDGQHPAGRVRRRVQPHQLHPLRPDRRQRVGGDGAGTGQPGADLVGRVGQRRLHHDVTRAEAEVPGQRGDQLLGADHRQHPGDVQPGHAEAAGQPVDRRLPGVRAADGERVPRRVGGRGEGPLHDLGRRVDGRADREVDEAVGVRTRTVAVRREVVPGEVRQRGGNRTRRPPGCGGRRVVVAGGHSAFCGKDSAATSGWSLSITPSLAAPPGEPRSSKKSTLAL